MKKELILEVNEDYGKTTARAVLEHLGYSVVSEYDEEKGKTIWKVYDPLNKEYRFRGWDHFNGFVFSITLEEI